MNNIGDFNTKEHENLEDKKNLDLCKKILDEELMKNILNEETLDDLVYMISWYLQYTKDIRAFNWLEGLCNNEQVDIVKRIYIYKQLGILKFEGTIDFTTSNISYRKLIRDILKKTKINDLKYLKNNKKNRIVFITDQFLGYGHSPTKILLNMIKVLNDKFRNIDEVYIFNATTFFSVEACSFYNSSLANYIKYDEGLLNDVLQQVGIDRCGVGYEERNEEDVIERLNTMAYEIHSLEPLLTIAVGGANVLGDLCNTFTEVYTYGLTRETPVASTRYLVNTTSTEYVRQYRINEGQDIIEIPFGFEGMKDSKDEINTREVLNLPKEDFLISIVGNRLVTEVTEEFLEVCKKILIKNSNTSIVFIGDYDIKNLKDKIDKKLYSRFYCVGYRKNLIQAVGLSDLFLNPIRQGGGYGGIAAIKSSIPIITTDKGDIAAYLTSKFKVEDYIQMGEFVNNIINNKALYMDLVKEIKNISVKYNKNAWEKFFRYILDQGVK